MILRNLTLHQSQFFLLNRVESDEATRHVQFQNGEYMSDNQMVH